MNVTLEEVTRVVIESIISQLGGLTIDCDVDIQSLGADSFDEIGIIMEIEDKLALGSDLDETRLKKTMTPNQIAMEVFAQLGVRDE